MKRARLLGGGLAAAALILFGGPASQAQERFPRPFGGQRLFPRAGAPMRAQGGFVRPVRPLVDQGAVGMLRRMVVAASTTPFIAHEASIRADGPGAEHLVKSDPRHGIRREPLRGKGMVTVDDFQHVYKFPASGRGATTVEESRQTRQMATKVLDLVRRLRNGTLRADIVGQDTIAGRVADIVQVSAPNTPGGTTRRFWIDRESGLRLRTEETDANGKVLSGSYYLSLDLNPQFAADDFTPPAATETAPVAPPVTALANRRFANLAAAARAGFPATAPAYVPNGYALRQVEVSKNGAEISLHFANGLNALSVILMRNGMPPRVQPFLRRDGTALVPGPQGQTFLFTPGANRSAYLLIGQLPEGELRRIAASLR